MKTLIIAATAALGLAGCVAVPAPYGPDAYYHPDAYYYPAPAVGFGIYAAPVPRHRHHHHRHHRHWHRR